MDPVQQQARALGDATRHRLFRLILEAGGPVAVAVLAAAVDVHPNAVRRHLSTLRDAGLVVEEREPRTAPGRPRLLYRPAPGAARAWPADGPYERLARLLLTALRTGNTVREVGRREGRAAGAAAGDGADPIEALRAVLAREGFAPAVHTEADGKAVVVLGHCPLAAAAAVDPDLVCDLHRGLVEGMADAAAGACVVTLRAGAPDVAGCEVRVHQLG